VQWLQDPKQRNVDSINNVRREVSRHFRNKKKEYLKVKIDELETNSVIKKIGDLHWSINDVKKGYKSRRNIVRDKKSDFVTDFHSILDRWRNRFSQLLNVIVSVIIGRQKYTQQNY
jgi:hypothetical protein